MPAGNAYTDVTTLADADEALVWSTSAGTFVNVTRPNLAANLWPGVNTVATSGAAQTLQVEKINDITLTANCTFTFPTATAGKSLTLVLHQDTTPRTVVWPANTLWTNGVEPTLSTASGAIDAFSFICVGGNWLSFVSGKAMS